MRSWVGSAPVLRPTKPAFPSCATMASFSPPQAPMSMTRTLESSLLIYFLVSTIYKLNKENDCRLCINVWICSWDRARKSPWLTPDQQHQAQGHSRACRSSTEDPFQCSDSPLALSTRQPFTPRNTRERESEGRKRLFNVAYVCNSYCSRYWRVDVRSDKKYGRLCIGYRKKLQIEFTPPCILYLFAWQARNFFSHKAYSLKGLPWSSVI